MEVIETIKSNLDEVVTDKGSPVTPGFTSVVMIFGQVQLFHVRADSIQTEKIRMIVKITVYVISKVIKRIKMINRVKTTKVINMIEFIELINSDQIDKNDQINKNDQDDRNYRNYRNYQNVQSDRHY